ncbi:MAG: hypothetical protein H0T62_10925 [Parachlamydiaceae bacterium]|nr:hypothetical protein [Parachlamydiaceae bacterium]
MHSEKILYRVKILDLKYLTDYDHLNFKYFIYEIEADCIKKALKKARVNYIKGMKPVFFEELPFVLKLFTVDQN